jgi:hypothetical protein
VGLDVDGIRYTTNGADPTTESALYTSPIAVNEPITIKARAFKSEMLDSVVSTFDYTVFDATAANISAGSASTPKGGTFTVPITLTNCPDVVGISFRVYFDASMLTLQSAVIPDGFNAFESLIPNSVGNGTLYTFNVPGLELVAYNGPILLLTFVASESAHDSIIVSISAVESSNSDDMEIPFASVNGVVKIISYLYGDFTGNGKVDATNVMWIRRYIAAEQDLQKMLESSPPTSINTFVEATADFTANGTLNSTDILWIRRYLAADKDKDAMLQLFPTTLTFDHL